MKLPTPICPNVAGGYILCTFFSNRYTFCLSYYVRVPQFLLFSSPINNLVQKTHQHDNGNIINRISINTALFNTRSKLDGRYMITEDDQSKSKHKQEKGFRYIRSWSTNKRSVREKRSVAACPNSLITVDCDTLLFRQQR